MTDYEQLFGLTEPVDTEYNYPLGEKPMGSFSGYSDISEDVSSNKMATATIIGLALEAVGIGANLWMNYSNNRRNDERQEQAYQQNLAMWREQSRYNTPENQIQRLLGAGLNPNLVYGSPKNVADSVPEKKASQGTAGRIEPLQAMNALLLKKQLDMTNAEISNIEADTRQKNATASGQENENSVFYRKFDLLVRDTNSRIGLNEKEANLKFNQSKLVYEEYVSRQLDNYFKDATMEQRIKAIQLQNNLTDEQIKVAKSAVSKAYAEISYLRKQGQLIDAKILTESVQLAFLDAQTNLTTAQREQVLADTQLKGQIEKYYVELTDKTAQDRRVGEIQEATMKSDLEWQRQKTGQGVGGLVGTVQMGLVGAVEIMGSLF